MKKSSTIFFSIFFSCALFAGSDIELQLITKLDCEVFWSLSYVDRAKVIHHIKGWLTEPLIKIELINDPGTPTYLLSYVIGEDEFYFMDFTIRDYKASIEFLDQGHLRISNICCDN